MERRANYVLIGLFTLAVIAGAFGFVFWIHYTSDKKQGVAYRIIFDGSVSGLRVGSSVLFNGIRVGEVTALKLDPASPSQVNALVLVNKATPIRSDTYVGLEFTGLTGIASVSLKGVSSTTQLLEREEGEPPTLKADITASQDMMAAAREVLAKVDSVITTNAEALHTTVANLESFTDTLKKNNNSIDEIMKNTKDATSSAKEAAAGAKELMDNLDKRTAEITVNANSLLKSAKAQIETAGKALTDLANHPQRILFGGGGGNAAAPAPANATPAPRRQASP